ncbi:hypothetical protein ACFL0K_01730 [Patescibacteria group bacterium]
MNTQNKKIITIFKIVLVISILFLVYITASLYLISNEEQIPDIKKQTIETETVVERHPLDIKRDKEIIYDGDLSKIEWVTYVDDMNGISFSHPSDFTIAIDEIKHEYENGKKWHYTFFDSDVRKQRTRFSININPDGIGPFFIDKRYFIEKKNDGKIAISSVIDATDQQILNDEIIWSYAKLDDDENKLDFHFIYEINGELDNVDYDAMFTEILESIEIK